MYRDANKQPYKLFHEQPHQSSHVAHFKSGSLREWMLQNIRELKKPLTLSYFGHRQSHPFSHQETEMAINCLSQ